MTLIINPADPVSHRSVLGHLAAAGAAVLAGASIDDPASGPLVGWDGTAATVTAAGHSALDLGEAIRAQAERVSTGWPTVMWSDGRPVFAPKRGPLSVERWDALELARQEAFSTIREPIDHQLITAILGVRHVGDQSRQGTPWDMQSTRAGAGIVQTRLAPLAAALATASPQRIVDGLAGRIRETARPHAATGSAMGWAARGTLVDDAVAWCAIWGLSLTRTGHRPGGAHGEEDPALRSITATGAARGIPGPHRTALWWPVPATPVRAQHIREMLDADPGGSDIAREHVAPVFESATSVGVGLDAMPNLHSVGAKSIVVWPVHTEQSGPSYVDRWVARGDVIAL